MVIRVSDYTKRCYTNDDGKKILNIIKPLMDSPNNVEISFNGINSVTSSFVNAAFIELLTSYGFDQIKSKLKFTNTNNLINSIIKKRFIFETECR